MKGRILVIDDEDDIRSLLRTTLERADYVVDEAADGRAGLRAFYETGPDLVVLDVTMPQLDGWATLERLRDLSDVPVLMLTARSSEIERVRGLTTGADDYVSKPFGRQELLARVGALLRRAGAGAGRRDAEQRFEDSFLAIDYTSRQVTVGDRPVQLTPLEFRLLATFVQNANLVLAKDQLLELVWGDRYHTSGDQVKLYVGYLRKKLGQDAPIETVRGFGYRYRKGSA